MNAKVTVLGCGNSTGVPSIGNHWGDCDPNEPKNARTRSSIAVQHKDTTLVIDTGPDFRAQLNRENIPLIDGVLYTHAHSDHVQGMDELRVMTFRNKTLTPIYASQPTLDDLHKRFTYLFEGGSHDIYPSIVEARLIENFSTPHALKDITFTPFEQDHGTVITTGYRFGNFGYSVDILRLDDAAVETLKGVDIWMVDCAAYKHKDNAVHANLETIFDLDKRIRPKQIYLSSLSLTMDYKTLCDELPDHIRPAFDGLSFDIKL
jgi:phosphoribosyl 1,2-cyclic phosphate phosphodiesterase